MDDSYSKFCNVICDLQDKFQEKNAQYGDSAFVHGANPSFKYWMRLSDVRRKTARMDNLTAHAVEGNKKAQKKLISDYKDLAIYAIIAVAVLEEQK